MSPRSGWRCITETRAEAGLFFWQFFRIRDREIHTDLDAHGFLADREIRLTGQVPAKRARRELFHLGRHRHAIDDNFD
jgi:hypothetical protein